MKFTTKQIAFNFFEAERQQYLAHCRDVAKWLFERHGNLTIDQVRDACPIPKDQSGVEKFKAVVLGAVFNSEWEKVGYVNTKRDSSHGRPVAVWRLKPQFRQTSYRFLDGSQMAFL